MKVPAFLTIPNPNQRRSIGLLPLLAIYSLTLEPTDLAPPLTNGDPSTGLVPPRPVTWTFLLAYTHANFLGLCLNTLISLWLQILFQLTKP